jgi:hypothetical protein
MLFSGGPAMVANHRFIGDEYDVVLVRGEDETVLCSGDLESCEEWLASNGDQIADGHFEIRPLAAATES